MKIVIITQNAPVYLGQFLDQLLEDLEHKVKGIVVLSPFFKKNFVDDIIERFHFYGYKSFFLMSGFILYNKIRSLIHNIFKSGVCFSVSNVIKKYELDREIIDDINSVDFINYIKDNKIDLIISIASPKIFKEKLINAPTLGCINYHTGFLPKYRGRQPLFWAMHNDEDFFGISIHFMDKLIDNGPIIVQQKIPIEPSDSLHSLYKKSITFGPKLLQLAINKIVDKTHKIIKNHDSEKTHYSFPSREDGKKFRSNNKNFF